MNTTLLNHPIFQLFTIGPPAYRNVLVPFLILTFVFGAHQSRAQNPSSLRGNSSVFSPTDDFPTADDESKEEELVELKDRLRQIESMLLAQKDRENDLLRDLNKFVLTSQDQPEVAAESQKELEAVQQWFRAESALLEAKISMLESAVAASHDRDIRMGQDMNKTIIVTVSVVAGIGLLVFLITVYLQYRLISRPVQPVYVQQSAPIAIEKMQPQLPKVDDDIEEHGLVENTKVEDANERFMSAIERLESRIIHMEAGLDTPDHHSDTSDVENKPSPTTESGSGIPVADETAPSVADIQDAEEVPEIEEKTEAVPKAVVVPEDMDVVVLEEEGKQFLQKEDWDTALLYFDQLIRLDPKRVDNWVNRGRALEMLKREEAALESYDKAIKTNPELPSPFLYKAALLSRLERFEEAQKFYNEALAKVPVQKSEETTRV